MALYPVNEIRVHVLSLSFGGRRVCSLACVCESFSITLCICSNSSSYFLNLWAIWIAINPRKRQLQYTLFRGVYGTICSVGLLVITQKYAYEVLQLQTPIYFILSFGLYGFALYLFIKIILKNFRNQEKIKIVERNWWCKSSSHWIGAVNC